MDDEIKKIELEIEGVRSKANKKMNEVESRQYDSDDETNDDMRKEHIKRITRTNQSKKSLQ